MPGGKKFSKNRQKKDPVILPNDHFYLIFERLEISELIRLFVLSKKILALLLRILLTRGIQGNDKALEYLFDKIVLHENKFIINSLYRDQLQRFFRHILVKNSSHYAPYQIMAYVGESRLRDAYDVHLYPQKDTDAANDRDHTYLKLWISFHAKSRNYFWAAWALTKLSHAFFEANIDKLVSEYFKYVCSDSFSQKDLPLFPYFSEYLSTDEKQSMVSGLVENFQITKNNLSYFIFKEVVFKNKYLLLLNQFLEPQINHEKNLQKLCKYIASMLTSKEYVPRKKLIDLYYFFVSALLHKNFINEGIFLIQFFSNAFVENLKFFNYSDQCIIIQFVFEISIFFKSNNRPEDELFFLYLTLKKAILSADKLIRPESQSSIHRKIKNLCFSRIIYITKHSRSKPQTLLPDAVRYNLISNCYDVSEKKSNVANILSKTKSYNIILNHLIIHNNNFISNENLIKYLKSLSLLDFSSFMREMPSHFLEEISSLLFDNIEELGRFKLSHFPLIFIEKKLHHYAPSKIPDFLSSSLKLRSFSLKLEMRLFYNEENYEKYLLCFNEKLSNRLNFFTFFIDAKKDFQKSIFYEREKFRSEAQVIFQNWFYKGSNVLEFFVKNPIRNIQNEITLFCYICERIALEFLYVSRNNPQSYYEAQLSIWRENAKENRKWCHAFFKLPYYRHMKRKDFSNALKVVSKPYQEKENGNTELQSRMTEFLKTVIIRLLLEKKVPLTLVKNIDHIANIFSKKMVPVLTNVLKQTLNLENDFEKKSFKTLKEILKKNDSIELIRFFKSPMGCYRFRPKNLSPYERKLQAFADIPANIWVNNEGSENIILKRT